MPINEGRVDTITKIEDGFWTMHYEPADPIDIDYDGVQKTVIHEMNGSAKWLMNSITM